jgi:hypothetical protein
MVYAAETEIEAIMGETFDASTPITTTQMTAMLVQWSATLDGLMGVSEGHFGAVDACPEWCKQAVIHVVVMYVNQIRLDQPPDHSALIRFMKEFIRERDREYSPPSIYKRTPLVGSNDSDEEWES